MAQIVDADKICLSLPIDFAEDEEVANIMNGYGEYYKEVREYKKNPLNIHGDESILFPLMAKLNELLYEEKFPKGIIKEHSPHAIMANRINPILKGYGYSLKINTTDLEGRQVMVTIASRQ
jgi:hypothetical protein